jgi:His-Xaa-Ser system protein HxsD
MYCQKAITAAVYKFTGDYFISQKTSGERVEVIFQKKPGADADFSLLSNLFENELIDQQVRLEVEEKFGAIRNLIVQKAFSPIN